MHRIECERVRQISANFPRVAALYASQNIIGEPNVIKLTSENVTAYVRIVIYHMGAFLITKGVMSGGSVEMWSGVLLNILTFGWTLWGQRVIAKINELTKIPNLIIVAPPVIAVSSTAVSTSEVKVVAK